VPGSVGAADAVAPFGPAEALDVAPDGMPTWTVVGSVLPGSVVETVAPDDDVLALVGALTCGLLELETLTGAEGALGALGAFTGPTCAPATGAPTSAVATSVTNAIVLKR